MTGEHRAVLIDASIPIFRYYFSLPERWVSTTGYSSAAVYGYAHWLRRLLVALQPRYVAACFDESLGGCFRNEIDPQYKCTRPPPDEALAFQLKACREVTDLMGVPSYASQRYEADDLIATLAFKNRQRGRTNTIITRDKDLGQLLREGDYLWNFPDDEPICSQGFYRKLGVAPHQVADYLALVGDAVDDIPGVPGIGPKTARALLAHMGSLDAILENLSSLGRLPLRGARQLAAKIAPFSEQAITARELATVCDRAPLGRRLQLRRRRADKPALRALAGELGFAFNVDFD